MKLFSAALFATVLAVSAGQAAPPEDATAELRPFMDKVNAAWMSLDPAKAAPFYAKDAGMAFYDVAPLKYTGWQEYQQGSEKAFSNWKSVKLTMNPDFKGYKNGNIAWATYTMDVEIQPKSGDVIKTAARGTDILEKRGGQWLIIHEHVSVPMPE